MCLVINLTQLGLQIRSVLHHMLSKENDSLFGILLGEDSKLIYVEFGVGIMVEIRGTTSILLIN